MDREHLLDTRRTRGFSANPWGIGSRFIVSHSVLSDETYMSGLRELLRSFRSRSLFILDEAHHAAPSAGLVWATESQLTRNVREIAAPFEHRLFLSATPHNGHANSFATLLEILDPQRFTRGVKVASRELEPVMVRRLKEDLRQLGHAFPRRLVEPIVIDNLPATSPELRLAGMLDEYRSASTGGSNARFLFSNLQQRLFSSIAAFDRTLRTHRRTLERKRDAAEAAGAAGDVLESDDLIELATDEARGELGALDAAMAHVERMLAITAEHRDRPDARMAKLLDWIGQEMLDERGQWRDRRLILFTEWDDTRRWLVDRLKEGLDERSRGRTDLQGRIVSFTGQTTLEERDRIKLRFNAPFEQDPIRILVCTDAAREGINLQARCHDLIHVDLPWNPSRLEQRNGRIDRKLQPSKTVTCRYFLYAQRIEDRVLDALVRKTETIRQQLGTAGEVLQQSIGARLSSGIARAGADALATQIRDESSSKVEEAQRDLDDAKRLEHLKEEEAWLQRRQEEARRKVGVEGDDLRRIVDLALADNEATLEPGSFSVPEALALDPDLPAFAKDASWAALFDELRPGRPPNPRERNKWRREAPVRGLVFAPPKLAEGQPEPQDVVQLHLEHRLVKRLISRFASQGFRASVGRIAAIVGSGAQPRVVLLGRLSLFGPGARRLHEEVIPVTALWRDVHRDTQPLTPFAEAGEQTTTTQLEGALRDGRSPGEGPVARLRVTVERDIADLRPYLEERARQSEANALKQLAENGEREAAALKELLERQIKRVRDTMRTAEPPDRPQGELFEETRQQLERERRQFEADRRSWTDKVERLERDLAKEPADLRDSYSVKARQLEPIGLIYLWPSMS